MSRAASAIASDLAEIRDELGLDKDGAHAPVKEDAENTKLNGRHTHVALIGLP